LGISPCIDAGTDAGVYDDIDEDPDPWMAHIDPGKTARFCTGRYSGTVRRSAETYR